MNQNAQCFNCGEFCPFVRLKDSELKISGMNDMVIIEENRPVLVAMNRKGLRSIVGTVEGTNIGQRIADPGETHKVTSYLRETVPGACQHEAPQQTI